jgi:hypothetical protein
LLSGCSPRADESADDELLSVVDHWIRALNKGDTPGFEKLHTESVYMTSNYQRDPFTGREEVWNIYKISTGNQIEKITAFRQEQSVCLLVNATKFNRSLCYVFNFSDGLIDSIYEYGSGKYYLTSTEQFSGIEFGEDGSGLADRLAILEEIFVTGLNNRDFSITDEYLADSAKFYVPTAEDPLIGKEEISKDGQAYAEFFSSVQHTKIETLGQGNQACIHVMVEGAPKGSLCWVAVFQEDSIAEIYEFWSDARLEG